MGNNLNGVQKYSLNHHQRVSLLFSFLSWVYSLDACATYKKESILHFGKVLAQNHSFGGLFLIAILKGKSVSVLVLESLSHLVNLYLSLTFQLHPYSSYQKL